MPVSVLLAGSFFLPRSPRWLLSKGLVEEAWEVTKKLHHDPSNPTFAEEEFEEMKAQIALEQRTGSVTPWGKARLAFSKASYRKRLGLGFLLQAGNQSVGNIVINNYQVSPTTCHHINEPVSNRLPFRLLFTAHSVLLVASPSC